MAILGTPLHARYHYGPNKDSDHATASSNFSSFQDSGHTLACSESHNDSCHTFARRYRYSLQDSGHTTASSGHFSCLDSGDTIASSDTCCDSRRTLVPSYCYGFKDSGHTFASWGRSSPLEDSSSSFDAYVDSGHSAFTNASHCGFQDSDHTFASKDCLSFEESGHQHAQVKRFGFLESGNPLASQDPLGNSRRFSEDDSDEEEYSDDERSVEDDDGNNHGRVGDSPDKLLLAMTKSFPGNFTNQESLHSDESCGKEPEESKATTQVRDNDSPLPGRDSLRWLPDPALEIDTCMITISLENGSLDHVSSDLKKYKETQDVLDKVPRCCIENADADIRANHQGMTNSHFSRLANPDTGSMCELKRKQCEHQGGLKNNEGLSHDFIPCGRHVAHPTNSKAVVMMLNRKRQQMKQGGMLIRIHCQQNHQGVVQFVV